MGSANFYGCGRFGLWAVLDGYDEEWYAQDLADDLDFIEEYGTLVDEEE